MKIECNLNVSYHFSSLFDVHVCVRLGIFALNSILGCRVESDKKGNRMTKWELKMCALFWVQNNLKWNWFQSSFDIIYKYFEVIRYDWTSIDWQCRKVFHDAEEKCLQIRKWYGFIVDKLKMSLHILLLQKKFQSENGRKFPEKAIHFRICAGTETGWRENAMCF